MKLALQIGPGHGMNAIPTKDNTSFYFPNCSNEVVARLLKTRYPDGKWLERTLIRFNELVQNFPKDQEFEDHDKMLDFIKEIGELYNNSKPFEIADIDAIDDDFSFLKNELMDIFKIDWTKYILSRQN